MAISVPPKGNSDREVGANFAPISVAAQDTPDLTVKIREGSFWTSEGNYVEHVGGNSSPMTAASAGKAKWNVVTLDSNSLIQIIQGVDSISPVLPTIPSNSLPLAAIYLLETSTEITADMVFDIRPLFVSHTEVVPNLQSELDDRPTTSDVNNLLLAKADIGGTTAADFILNQDLTGPGNTDASLTVNRGSLSNVSIRWNETSETWQLTNDGTIFSDIGTASGAAIWGSITGSLTNQTDLQSALDAKADLTAFNSHTADATHFLQSAIDITASQVNDFDTVAGIAADTQIGLANVGDLLDVFVATPLDKHVLIYDGVTNNRFENRLLAPIDVALGSVDDTADADKPVSTATQTALDLKANIASPVFTGIPVLPSTAKVGLTLGVGLAAETAGSVVFVTDDAGSPAFVLAYVDAAITWRRMDDNTAIV